MKANGISYLLSGKPPTLILPPLSLPLSLPAAQNKEKTRLKVPAYYL